jgi:hypothetical protein
MTILLVFNDFACIAQTNKSKLLVKWVRVMEFLDFSGESLTVKPFSFLAVNETVIIAVFVVSFFISLRITVIRNSQTFVP